MDAQNAPTGTWKLQNSFHSANSDHPLRVSSAEKGGSVTSVLRFHRTLVCRGPHQFLATAVPEDRHGLLVLYFGLTQRFHEIRLLAE